MKRFRLMLCGVLCVLFYSILSATPAFAAGYSADMVTTGKNGAVSQSKIWVSYSTWAQRLEPAAQPNMIIIVRLNQRTVWNIDTKEKRYMEIPLRADLVANAIATGEKTATEVERTYLLTETVEGYLADKYQLTHVVNNNRMTHFIWLLKDNNLFPIKTQYKDTVTVFKNLVLEEPAASLFEIPAGYQKFTLPFTL
jgi:hypothetical protein